MPYPGVLSAACAATVTATALGGCGGGHANARRAAGPTRPGAWAVTAPNLSRPPGEPLRPADHGNGTLWTLLPPDGRVVGIPQRFLSQPAAITRAIGRGIFGIIRPDRSIAAKFPWFAHSGTRGPLTVTGRRLDGPAPPLRVDGPTPGEIPGSPRTRFWASRLVFPSTGCWKITATLRGSSLPFTVRVVESGLS